MGSVEEVDKAPPARVAPPPQSLRTSGARCCVPTSLSFCAQHVQRKYDIGQKLGKGAYAVVFKATDKKSKAIVAVKKIFDAFQARARTRALPTRARNLG